MSSSPSLRSPRPSLPLASTSPSSGAASSSIGARPFASFLPSFPPSFSSSSPASSGAFASASSSSLVASCSARLSRSTFSSEFAIVLSNSSATSFAVTSTAASVSFVCALGL